MVILSLVSQKGGVSKSTLALGLAWELLARRQSVLLVDADPQGTCWEASSRAGEADPSATPTTVRASGKLDMVRAWSATHDVTLIDTPGRMDVVLRASLSIADVALVLVSPSGPDAWAVRDTVAVVQRAQELRPGLKAALVVTRRIPRSTLGEEARRQLKALGLPVFKSSTCNRTAWAEASTEGLGVTKYAPRSKAAEELRAVLSETIRFSRRTR